MLEHLILLAEQYGRFCGKQLIEIGLLLGLLRIFLEGTFIGGAVFIKGNLIERLECLEETHWGYDCMKIIIIPNENY